ncbi:MAG: hypothetical protein ACRDRA_17075 [Pseudonocardiaceae bacterium]
MRCARCGREILAAESGEFFEEEPAVPDDAVRCPACAVSTEQPATGVLFAAAAPELWADDKIREIRLRQMAERQGLVLMKAQHWAPHASGWGLYWPATVADTSGHWPSRLLVSPDVGLTLDGVEEFLTYGTTRAAIMEYLIRSYGPVFVEELIKHLPQRRANASNLGQE